VKRPDHSVWGKINADLGTTLSKVLTEGLDVKEALDGVAERNPRSNDEAGYYTWR
jgi:multiple sugar transport system substrate-binding protein